MELRRIKVLHYEVVAVDDPVEGESVRSILAAVEQLHPRIHLRAMTLLARQVPTEGPPFLDEGFVRAKELYDGISEFIVLNCANRRRERARQTREEKNLGLRIFFFQYGKTVVCTNACLKTSRTPPDAIPAAIANRAACLPILRLRTFESYGEE